MTMPPPPLDLNAVVAVDVVLFTVRLQEPIERAWQVLLVRDHETFDGAARRALRTKAGLDAAHWYLEQLGTFGAPDRDTRGRVVSVAHLALEQSDDLSLVPGGRIMRAEWVP